MTWELAREYLWQFLIVLNYLIAIIAAITVLLGNLSPSKTLSYLIVLIVFPFVGVIFYYFFGQEYRKNKLFKRKNVLNQTDIKLWETKLNHNKARLEKGPLSDKIKLIRLLKRNKLSPLTFKNKVELLINGENKFRRLFEDITNATQTIHLEYYILEDDTIGTELIDLLCRRAEEGVEVRLSYDYVGSSVSVKSRRKLKKSGVEFHPFMPVYFPKFTSKLNHRNHRKIVVIDGRIGYVGGINISDRYVNNGQDTYWRDTHLRLEGESVSVLQLHFMLHWDFVTPYDIDVKSYFFNSAQVLEKTPVQIAACGPDTDWASIMEATFTAINTAQKYVYICTPYFIPNDEIIMALVAGARSGIEVKLIIPEESDSWGAKYATYAFVKPLLEAGVNVHLYTKGFIHAKVMLVDDVFSTIGTANMDNRSFNINFEINALIYDEAFTAKVLESFNEDLTNSRQVTLEEWNKRGIVQQLKEGFCRLWAPLL